MYSPRDDIKLFIAELAGRLRLEVISIDLNELVYCPLSVSYF